MLYVSAGYLFLMRINNNLLEKHAVDTVTTLKHHKSKNKFKKVAFKPTAEVVTGLLTSV